MTPTTASRLNRSTTARKVLLPPREEFEWTIWRLDRLTDGYALIGLAYAAMGNYQGSLVFLVLGACSAMVAAAGSRQNGGPGAGGGA
jgi:hypothetical protein